MNNMDDVPLLEETHTKIPADFKVPNTCTDYVVCKVPMNTDINQTILAISINDGKQTVTCRYSKWALFFDVLRSTLSRRIKVGADLITGSTDHLSQRIPTDLKLNKGWETSYTKCEIPCFNSTTGRTQRALTVQGITASYSEWASFLGVHVSSLSLRVDAGASININDRVDTPDVGITRGNTQDKIISLIREKTYITHALFMEQVVKNELNIPPNEVTIALAQLATKGEIKKHTCAGVNVYFLATTELEKKDATNVARLSNRLLKKVREDEQLSPLYEDAEKATMNSWLYGA